MFLQQFPHEGNHHNGSGQVVEDGAKEERNECNEAKQAGQAFCLNSRCHHIKAVVGIDNLDDRHGPYQEKDDLGCFSYGMTELLADQSRICSSDSINGPQQPCPSSADADLLICSMCSSAMAR